jgi:hypothetical protein
MALESVGAKNGGNILVSLRVSCIPSHECTDYAHIWVVA